MEHSSSCDDDIQVGIYYHPIKQEVVTVGIQQTSESGDQMQPEFSLFISFWVHLTG